MKVNTGGIMTLWDPSALPIKYYHINHINILLCVMQYCVFAIVKRTSLSTPACFILAEEIKLK